VRVRWLKPALKNLDDEAEYIARDNPQAAGRIVERIATSVDRLATHPASGRPGRVPVTRELVISGTPYIVPYRVRDKTVEVLRLFHAARKWQRSLIST
jgi:addiction module RelE/StbE family toxin